MSEQALRHSLGLMKSIRAPRRPIIVSCYRRSRSQETLRLLASRMQRVQVVLLNLAIVAKFLTMNEFNESLRLQTSTC